MMLSAADPAREGQRRWDKKTQEIFGILGITGMIAKNAAGYSYLEEGIMEGEPDGSESVSEQSDEN